MSNTTGQRILYVAFPFPPSRGAGVYRTVATVNFLSRAGWGVTVVAPEESYFQRYQGSEDRSLISWVADGVDVVRVPLTNWLLEDDLRRMPLVRVLSPRSFGKRVGQIQRFLSPLDHYPFWLLPALRATLGYARRHKIDVILATGNPFNSFVVAAAVARRLGIPYVLDFRDAWTFDQFTGQMKPLASDLALPLERRLLHGAGAFISVNQPIVDWLSDNHSVPNAVERLVVPNGYDPEFVTHADPTPRRNGMVRYAHVGTLVPQKMDWLEMLNQFDRISQLMADEVELNVYGHLGFSASQDAELRHVFETYPRITYHGPIQRSEINDVYNSADVLYLPLYESPYVTSGKVYEMMATRKPILAWGADSAGALEPLRGYPKLVRADPSRPGLLARAMEAANALSSLASPELEESTSKYVDRYTRDKALEPLGQLLSRLIR